MNKMNTNIQQGYWKDGILDMSRNEDGSPYVHWSTRDVDWSQFTEPEILHILSDDKPLLPLTRKQWILNNRKK